MGARSPSGAVACHTAQQAGYTSAWSTRGTDLFRRLLIASLIVLCSALGFMARAKPLDARAAAGTCTIDDPRIGQPCDNPFDMDDCESGVFECLSGTLNCTDDSVLDDLDGDGVWDCKDTCIGDDALIGQPCDSTVDEDDCKTGLFLCSSGTLTCTDDFALDDVDGDGLWDCRDDCLGNDSEIGRPCDNPLDPDNCATGVIECSTGTLNCTDDELVDDLDGDGVWDCKDTCIGDNALIGRPCDSAVDADNCKSAPYHCNSGTLTCGDDNALDDADGDGIADCVDHCIGDDGLIGQPCDSPVDNDNCKNGQYECTTTGTLTCTDDDALDDADGDGVWDCNDTCDGDDALLGQPCDSAVDTDICASGIYDCATGMVVCNDDDALDDADGDGILDCDDHCVGNDALIDQLCDSNVDIDSCATGQWKCSFGILICTDDDALDDADGDGVWDCHDPCVGDETLIGNPCDSAVDPDDCSGGTYSCTSGTLLCTDDVFVDDEDADGVWDCHDTCPGTAVGVSVDSTGCSCTQAGPSDLDGDTIIDGCDNCPAMPNTDQADVDTDGVGDVCDVCVGFDDRLLGRPCDGNDADVCVGGVFECSSGTLACDDDPEPDDADGDGILDCNDNCIGDDALIGNPCDSSIDIDNCAGGVYECSSGTLACADDDALDDADGDGVWDCNDSCLGDNSQIGLPCDNPLDPDDCATGVFECSTGTLSCTDDEFLDDSDGDGVWDCNDDCVGDNALIGRPCDSTVDADNCKTASYSCESGTLTCNDDNELDDADEDGVWDCNDTCIGDDDLIGQPCDSPVDVDNCENGVYECATGTLLCTDDDALDDSDGDGVWDCVDVCNGDDAILAQTCDSGVDSDSCALGDYDCATDVVACNDDDALDDADGDGIPDCVDTCVGIDALIGQPCDNEFDVDDCRTGVFECSSGILTCTDDLALDDADADGVWDCHDPCNGDETLIGNPCDNPVDPDDCASGTYSCSSGGALTCSDDVFVDDEDVDGVWDCNDTCPGTVAGSSVDSTGCSCDQLDTNDSDSDTIPNGCDNCPNDPNQDQADQDADGVGNACDLCVGDNRLIGQPCDGDDVDLCKGGTWECSTGSLACNDDPAMDDTDGDGIDECHDNCPNTPPGEPIGATGCACSQLGLAAGLVEDSDADGVPNVCDNCPNDANTDQANSDGDAIGDACDSCDGDNALINQPCDSPVDADACKSGVYECSTGSLLCTDDNALDDEDGDGVCNAVDRCPGFDDNVDVDGDGVPDDCDNCRTHANADQNDCDNDGIGDVCAIANGLAEDPDGDTIPSTCDNCPLRANTDQADCDNDGTGDVCAIAAGLAEDCNANNIPDGCESGQRTKLTASDAVAVDWFGSAVSINGNRAVVGAFQSDCGSFFGCGAAYVFHFDGASWTQKAKLTASDAAETDWFGFSVSISGTTAVVGAFKNNCVAGNDCGAVYLYEFDGTTWTQVAKLTVSDAAANDQLGYSVAISGDTVIAGARMVDCAAGINCGAAYVFEKPSSGWLDITETAKLTASDAASEDRLGVSVAMDGDAVIVGAYWVDCATEVNCGAAYVFDRPVAGWVDMTETAKLTVSDAAGSDEFGISVSMDAGTAVVGARWVSCPAGSDCGAAYVFEKPAGGWATATETAKLTASDAAASDRFGHSVSLSGDTVVIGAQSADCLPQTDCGAAYVFREPIGGWSNATESAKLTASDAAQTDWLGASVSVSGDTTVLGAQLADCSAGIDCGAVYVLAVGAFDCNGNGIPDICDIREGVSQDCDGDGVPNECDPDDEDADGVLDCDDLCPGTLSGALVDVNGCPIGGACCLNNNVCTDGVDRASCDTFGGLFLDGGVRCDADHDNDGVFGCADLCPRDENKIDPGVCGCGTSDAVDTDNDLVPDCIDLCPATPTGATVDQDGCTGTGACCATNGGCLDNLAPAGCQLILGTYQGQQTSCAAGCVFGDFDGDGDADLRDVSWFLQCFTGVDGGPLAPQCLEGDFDGDGDIDVTDAKWFLAAGTGP